MPAHAPLLVLLFPFLGALLVPLVYRRRPRVGYGLALAASIASFGCALSVGGEVLAAERPLSYRLGGWEPPWGIELRVDHLSALMAVLVCALSLVVLVFGRRGLELHLVRRGHFFYALYLLFTAGLLGMCLTGDLFNFYVFLEVSSLTGYALIAAGEPRAPLSAFRYLVLGSLGAMFYLLGIAYLYGLTGSLNFADVASRLGALHEHRTVLVALAFLVAGLGIKAALFPLHAWLPDAYCDAPSTTSAFMAAVGTKIGAYGIFRVLFTLYGVEGHPQHQPVVQVMGALAAIAILVGSALAISQTDLKRMLAYSSVSQIGYVLLGFSLLNAQGITGGVLHIVAHAFMKCCLFLAAGALMLQVGHRNIRQFDGLGRRAPLTMAAFTVAALSMIGLPPTAGFFSKWYLVLGAISAGRWVFVAVILASSLLNAVYFFRILERAYLRKGTEPAQPPHRLPVTVAVPVGLTAASLLVIGLGSWTLVEQVIRFIVPGGLG